VSVEVSVSLAPSLSLLLSAVVPLSVAAPSPLR
jgi:hypothetical protein